MSRLTASRAAFDLIASFEGFRTRAVMAPDGQWTLGFGHIATAREGLTVTRAEAEDLLRWDLLPIEDALRQIALTPLSQSQFDALVSFAFNIGLENFRKSDVLKYLNQGQPVAAALSMHAWRRAQVNGRVLTIDALVRRRAAESAMFLETTGARPAAPSSVIRPQIDYAAALLSHGAETTKVETNLNPKRDEAEQSTQTADDEVSVHQDDVPTLETAIDHSPVVILAETTTQEVVREAPVILPPLPIPPISPLGENLTPPLRNLGARQESVPLVPQGLSPFPGNTIYTPANGIGDTITAPANDGQKTRLHNIPEILETPAKIEEKFIKPFDLANLGTSVWAWLLMALGAALLAFGLYYSWKAGVFTVASSKPDPTTSELLALFAAASGLLILVTTAVSALNGPRDAS